jgi:5'-nucleotidase
MKKTYIVLYTFLSIICFYACCKKDTIKAPVALGEIKVDLDATEPAIRTKETLIGNMICDAIKADAELKGKVVDFAVVNGGGIRFNNKSRPSGIYPAGFFTTEMIDEMLPFGNTSVVIQITGKELKSMFERSVSQLPLSKGPFLQISKEVQIIIDTTKSPQLINELVEPNVIISNGNRITSIKIHNIAYDSLASYTIVVNDFIADGNDGYITLKNVSADKKENLNEDQTGAVKEYIIINTPLTPVIEGRILYQ